jgi:type II secretory pathway predicted ATPase ExeA
MNRTTNSRPVTATPRFDDKMYLSHYGLKRKPFEIDPDRGFFGRGKNSRVVIRVVASTQG